MSGASGPWALLRWVLSPENGLRPADRLVVLSLLQHGDAEDPGRGAHPSITRLAACTGLNRETVILALRRLEAKGVLSREVRAGVRTEYTLNLNQSLFPTSRKEVPVPNSDRGSRKEVPVPVGKGDSTVPYTVPSTVHGRAGALTADFETFYKAYPRKVGKPDALKAWKATAKGRPALEVLLASVRAHADSEQWRAEGGRFIPYPATFLRQGRWEDELDGAPGGGVKPPAPSADDLEALRLAREADGEVNR